MTILLIAAGRPQEIAPTIQRISPPIPCIVGAGLAPALGWCGATAHATLPFALMGLARALWACPCPGDGRPASLNSGLPLCVPGCSQRLSYAPGTRAPERGPLCSLLLP